VAEVLVFRAGPLHDPAASLNHPLIRAVHDLRPAGRPGFDDTIFCSLTYAAAVMWSDWAINTHSPAGVEVTTVAAVSDNVWIYPFGLWEDIHAAHDDGQDITLTARAYWQSGQRWTDRTDRAQLVADDPYTWEAIVPVADIRDTQIALRVDAA